MLWGAQVRQAGGLLVALRRAEDMGAEVLQLFVQSNRQWRLPDHPAELYDAYRRACRESTVVRATVCHAPYLVNLVSPDPLTVERSRRSLRANLRAATLLGAFGLVLHPGSHRGTHPEQAVGSIADAVAGALDDVGRELGTSCDVLLENTAGSGHSVGRSFEELGALLDAAGSDERIGVCLDTQHLWAAGIRFDSPARADAVVADFHRRVGLGRLSCLHLNDSKVPLGAGSDRHENLGQGTIGARGLEALLGHPELQRLPAVLEVPGLGGKGPAADDLALARRLHARALASRTRRERSGRRHQRTSV